MSESSLGKYEVVREGPEGRHDSWLALDWGASRRVIERIMSGLAFGPAKRTLCLLSGAGWSLEASEVPGACQASALVGPVFPEANPLARS